MEEASDAPSDQILMQERQPLVATSMPAPGFSISGLAGSTRRSVVREDADSGD